MAPCIFCEVAAGRKAADIVFQDDSVVAFRDINPQAPTHILVIPHQHVSSVADTSGTDSVVLGTVVSAAAQVAATEGLERSGYRLVINHGTDGGQSVAHLHVHLLGGRPLSWPPG